MAKPRKSKVVHDSGPADESHPATTTTTTATAKGTEHEPSEDVDVSMNVCCLFPPDSSSLLGAGVVSEDMSVLTSVILPNLGCR